MALPSGHDPPVCVQANSGRVPLGSAHGHHGEVEGARLPWKSLLADARYVGAKEMITFTVDSGLTRVPETGDEVITSPAELTYLPDHSLSTPIPVRRGPALL